MDWHKLDIDEVFKETGSSRTGLSTQGAEASREKYGANELEEAKKTPPWKLFVEQFKSFMIIVLIAAAVVSGIVGDKTDTIIILIIVLLNAVIGFLQEYRAEKAMSALRSIGTPTSRVFRDGKERNIKSTDIVPGDVVILEAGVIVPADMRLFESHSLRIEESALTGESVAVDKTIKPLEDEATQLGDRLNMSYKGTKVTNGRGLGVVTATGMNTEIGKIAQMLQEPKTSTPLQLKMEDFGKKLSYLIIAICTVLFLIGLVRGEEPLNMLLVAISLAVAAIPEALPALITIALAQGAKRLVKKNALIRKLPAVETLGSVSYICTDKTGTLTRNSMTVTETHDGHSPANMPSLQTIMCLNHDVAVADDGALLGDPMETAIVDYVRSKENVDVAELQQRYPRVGEIPFDADRKCMTTIHEYDDQYLIVSKGAVEAITRTMEGSANNNDITKEINEKNRLLASQGMRVIAYGYKFARDIGEPINEREIETGLTYAGLVALIDPPREEVKPAILECKQAGIQPVMITGDHPETAAAIAQQINLLAADDLKISGYELNDISQQDFEKDVERIKVYSRVSPEQKLQIVKALQSRDHFVAMTGDGVNDAPSLKVANIGVAMGITGTDVSKESSDMILLDDNFATIVNAIKEGRRIYDNIRKFVRYIMTCNSAEIWTIFVAPIIGLPIPLLPIHLLWINLVTDGLPGLALSAEKAEADIMRRPPRGRNESLFSHGAGTHIIWVGILMAALTLGIELWAVKTNNPNWQTMVFTVLSLAQLGHVFAIRSEKQYIFKVGLFSNRPLAFAVLFTFALQMAVIYLPIANELLKTKPLPLNDLLICMLGPVVIFFGVELEKLVRRRRHLD